MINGGGWVKVILVALGGCALFVIFVIAGCCVLAVHDSDLLDMHPPDAEKGNDKGVVN